MACPFSREVLELYQRAGKLHGRLFKVYHSFFAHTLDLRNVPAYLSIKVPMLAICGSGEVKDMKLSLDMLGKNACCQTMILSKAGHDFPMKNSKGLNAVLNDFLLGKIKEN